MTTSNKISFILIGRNEERNILRACTSVQTACINEGVNNFEIIFVDSNSTDHSIEEALKADNISIYKITQSTGAAIARNVGAEKASGSILFFMDGDMELLPGYISKILNDEGNLVHPFVSGNWENWYYTVDGTYQNKELYKKTAVATPTYQTTTGGFFAMESQLWHRLNGMDTRFLTGQDLDLGLRSSTLGVKLLRLPILGVNHHTVNYRDEQRKWKSLMAFRDVYARALLYRKHLLRTPFIFKRMVTGDPTWLFLCFAIVVSIVLGSGWLLAFYPPLVIAAAALRRKKESIKIFASEVAFLMVRDFFNLIAFLFFYPAHPKYAVETIQERKDD